MFDVLKMLSEVEMTSLVSLFCFLKLLRLVPYASIHSNVKGRTKSALCHADICFVYHV